MLFKPYTIYTMVKGQRYPKACAYLPHHALYEESLGRTTAPKFDSELKTERNPNMTNTSDLILIPKTKEMAEPNWEFGTAWLDMKKDAMYVRKTVRRAFVRLVMPRRDK